MQKLCYSEWGLRMTKKFEGLRLKAYQDVAGVWTIGYGHTGHDVHAGKQVTEAEAEALLLADMESAVSCVNRLVEVELTQGQFDALVDFCFNLGERSLHGSTLLRLVNAGDFQAAVKQFVLWDHAGGKVQAGLARRRQAEVKMFMS